MEVNNLRSYELDYELMIRGVTPAGDVDKRRKILRGLLSQEKNNRSFSEGFVVCYDHADDVKEIKNSLQDLQSKVSTFTNNSNDLKRLNSRLCHVSGRIRRLVTSEEAQEDTKKQLHIELLEIEGDLALKTSDPQPMQTSTPSNSNQQPYEFSFCKPVPPCKWNIYFSGDSRRESLISFLEKVDAFSFARNVSKQELFLSAGDLFKDHAWTWYNNNRKKLSNWDELVQKLKDDFLPYHYDEDLRREIDNRTQGVNEGITIYMSSMEALFNRLKVQPPEQEKVNIIRRNLSPVYISHLSLHEIKTISELTGLCKKLEESLEWSERYRPPPSRKSFLLEPDLSCSSQEPRNPNHRKYNNSNREISALNTVRCWNCSKIGHAYSRCPSPRTTFCFGCGRKGMIKTKCPRCSPKNFKGGSANLGAVATTSKGPESNNNENMS